MVPETPSLDSIFCSAIELASAEERAAYIAQACGGDAGLRQRVQKLVVAHFRAGSFLQRPAAGPGVTADFTPLPAACVAVLEGPGTVIGPYRLLEPVGEGGMGVVYVAEQTEPIRRRVALKVIKPGMDTRQVIARFERERQALALMDHPNIAKVLDAGATPEGRPYFVMELVKGVPITEFCDQDYLTPRQRLELFLDVCSAVQHAHQKGIIHRDLKPSNVLVAGHDGTPVVKVIDFGIAKAVGGQLTDRGVSTAFAQMVGTPLYMSPEQAGLGGLDIDTRSDVYSLGVLLYELLTGTTPFDGAALKEAGYDGMRRIIREEEPPRPSARISTLGTEALSTVAARRGTEARRLSRQLRGELDWVVMKALEKDRNRRYETPNTLAADVQRYLKGEPVLACPPSAVYTLRKFLLKHRAGALTAAAFLGVLLLAVAVSAWQAVRAWEAEGKAWESTGKAINALQAKEEALGEVRQERDRVQKALERAEFVAYAFRLREAQGLIERGRLDEARAVLGTCAPKLCGWEYDHLLRQTDRLRLQLRGHQSPVVSVCFSPDGKRIASASMGGYDVRREKVPRPGEVKIWDASTGQQLLAFNEPGPVYRVTFSPDGQRLACATGVWDERQRSKLTSGVVQVRDAETGREILSLKGHTLPVWDVCFSPDGRRLASAGVDRTVRVWDAKTGRVILSLDHTGIVNYVRFSPDGQRLASATMPEQPDQRTGLWCGEIKVWDARTGQELLTLRGHTGAVSGVCFSPDGQRIASASEGAAPRGQTPTGEIKIWDGSTGREVLAVRGLNGRFTGVCFSPDGQRIAAGNEPGKVTVWDAQTGQELLSLKPVSNGNTRLYSVCFSPDGQHIAAGGMDLGDPNKPGGDVKIWDAGPALASRDFEERPGISAACLSPDCRLVARANPDGTVVVRDARTGQELRSLKGHTGVVARMCFGPDGKQVAVASWKRSPEGKILPGEVKVWDVRTGNEVVSLNGPADPVESLCFSPDGKRLAAGTAQFGPRKPPEPGWVILSEPSQGGEVRVWDAVTGQEIFVLKGHTHRVVSVGFTPDGKRLVSVSGEMSGTGYRRQAKVWDAQTGRELGELVGANLSAPCVSPDSKWIALGVGDPSLPGVATEGVVKVLDARTGKEAHTLQGHASRVTQVCFSPDARRIASASEDQTVKVWDTATGRLLHSLKGHTEPVVGVCFSPDGRRIVSASSRAVKVWDTQTGQEALALGVAGMGQGAVCFSPDGLRIGIIAPNGGAKLWDTGTDREVFSLRGHTTAVAAVCFSPDGRHIASVSGGPAHPHPEEQQGEAKLWDAATGRELLTIPGQAGGLNCLCFSPDGRRLAVGSWLPDSVRVWDLATSQVVHALQGHTLGVSSVCFSPDGRRIVTGSWDKTVKVWDADSGRELLTLRGHDHGVSSVCVSPDGRLIASGSVDHSVRVWDAATGRERFSLKAGHLVWSVRFSPDGKQLAASSGVVGDVGEGGVQVWDTETGRLLQTHRQHTSGVTSVMFSPDGRRLVSGGRDNTVKVWDVGMRREVLTLRGHTKWVSGVCISPDGNRIASASLDGAVKVWDMPPSTSAAPAALPGGNAEGRPGPGKNR